MMIMRFFFSDFLYKGICCGYSFELHRQVDAIQMRTHNICLYKKVNKKYTGCNLKTTEFHDCALIGVCAVIRSNTVTLFFLTSPFHQRKVCHRFWEVGVGRGGVGWGWGCLTRRLDMPFLRGLKKY